MSSTSKRRKACIVQQRGPYAPALIQCRYDIYLCQSVVPMPLDTRISVNPRFIDLHLERHTRTGESILSDELVFPRPWLGQRIECRACLPGLPSMSTKVVIVVLAVTFHWIGAFPLAVPIHPRLLRIVLLTSGAKHKLCIHPSSKCEI